MACRMKNTQATILSVPPFSLLCDAAFALRREVFVLEQNVPEDIELDEFDSVAEHYVAIVGGNVVGTLRVVDKGDHAKIGRVAVRASVRGQGIAHALMTVSMDAVRRRGQTRFHLSSQSDKVGFYERFGFRAEKAEYLDAGIPHRDMRTF